MEVYNRLLPALPMARYIGAATLAKPKLELRALTVGQSYWVAIESFSENGVSKLSAAVPIRFGVVP